MEGLQINGKDEAIRVVLKIQMNFEYRTRLNPDTVGRQARNYSPRWIADDGVI